MSLGIYPQQSRQVALRPSQAVSVSGLGITTATQFDITTLMNLMIPMMMVVMMMSMIMKVMAPAAA